MAASEPQDMAVLPTQVVVSSESDPGATYLVHLPYCPCKDFRYRRAGLLARLAAGGAGVTLDELFCKHLRRGLALVGGWHGTPQDPEHVVEWQNLLHGDVKALLQGKSVGFSARQANQVIAAAIADETTSFKASLTGVAADGVLAYDGLTSRYTLTLTR
jgi:hypothetical protein